MKIDAYLDGEQVKMILMRFPDITSIIGLEGFRVKVFISENDAFRRLFKKKISEFLKDQKGKKYSADLIIKHLKDGIC